MHHGTTICGTFLQASCCAGRPSPRLSQRAEGRPVLKLLCLERVVQPIDRRCVGAQPRQRLVDALRPLRGDELARAMHRRAVCQPIFGLGAAHLEASIAYSAINNQSRRLHGERLQEVDAVRCCPTSSGSASELEVAGTRKDNTAVHDVVSNHGVQGALRRGAEGISFVGNPNLPLCERVWRVDPRKRLPSVLEH